MRIVKKKDKVLLEQEQILASYAGSKEHMVVLFKDTEKLLIVLNNILDGKFVELLVENKVFNYYTNIVSKQVNNRPYQVFSIYELLIGLFTWGETSQGHTFWYGINRKFNNIIREYYEN